MPTYAHLLNLAVETPWAIVPERLNLIAEILRTRREGAPLTAEEVQARVEAAKPPAPPVARESPHGIGLISLVGTLIPRGSMLAQSSGAMGMDGFRRSIEALDRAPQVGAIVIEVDSPGGSVAGIEEAADAVYAARRSKPVVAVADSLAASGAYWVASAATQLSVTPSGMVGSIGVLALHESLAGLLDQRGVEVSLISAGKYKGEASPYRPLSDDARAAIQHQVDTYYGAFTRAVARGRGVTVEVVRGGFGEGRVVTAHEAVEMGMADRIETLDQAIERVAGEMRARQRVASPAARARLA